MKKIKSKTKNLQKKSTTDSGWWWILKGHMLLHSNQNKIISKIKMKLPRSSLRSKFERSLDCLYLTAATGSCNVASVGIARPRCTTKPECASDAFIGFFHVFISCKCLYVCVCVLNVILAHGSTAKCEQNHAV